MIKRLRRRFILLAFSVIFCILALIILIINIRNYAVVRKSADDVLTILYERGGSFDFRPEEDFTSDIINFIDYRGNDNRNENQGMDYEKDKPENMSFDKMMSMVTFYVKKTGNTYSFYKSRNVYTIDEAQAIAMFDAVVANGVDRGYVDTYYRYYNTYDTETSTYMVIFMDCTETISSARAFLRSSLIISGIGLLAFLVIVIIVSRFIFKPVEEAYQKQKRFIANAGHELKTPLTIISANNEVEEMVVGENEQTAAISKQVVKLTSMVNSLTKLALLEENYKLEKIEDFVLSDAILDVLDSYDFKFKEKNLNLCTNLEKDIIFKGDEGLFRVLISIILDNALKYSISSINVTLKKNKKIEIEISNDSRKISDGDHPELFERFYRTEEARASSVQGSGIGLSIAKEIVQVHKGKISALAQDNNFIIRMVF